MRFLFAPDSFKGSLTAAEICRLLERAAAVHFPEAQTHSIPVADGGEGTVEALVLATGGRTEQVRVTGPMGGETSATYGILGDGETAVLEMAQASGLPLAPQGQRDPLRASSYGTGEMIRHVAESGARRLLIGLGGSATNDGGMGMLTALGVRFTDAAGQTLRGSGAELGKVRAMDASGLIAALGETSVTVISDVNNPLLGERGATMVYGPQKGADAGMLGQLEAGMTQYALVLRETLGRNVAGQQGAGAAGGMGAALLGVLGAEMRPGIDAVLDVAGFDERLRGASLVVTGEGRMDGQSIRYGKVPAGVAARCARQGVPVVAIVGGMTADAAELYDLATASIMTTVNDIMPLDRAMGDAAALFASAADRMFRMLKIGRSL